jgi:hypothetical protein
VRNADERVEKAEARWDLLDSEYQLLRDSFQTEKRQMQTLVDRLIAEWGPVDPALRDALQAIRSSCEIRAVRSEPDSSDSLKSYESRRDPLAPRIDTASRLDLRGAGPQLSC